MRKRPFRMLRVKEVLEILGVGKTTLYEMIKDGRLSKPLRIGKRAVGWPSTDIDAYLESQPRRRKRTGTSLPVKHQSLPAGRSRANDGT